MSDISRIWKLEKRMECLLTQIEHYQKELGNCVTKLNEVTIEKDMLKNEVNRFRNSTEILQTKVTQLRKELREITVALDDERVNLTHTTVELILELRNKVERLSEELNVRNIMIPEEEHNPNAAYRCKPSR